MTSEDIKNKKRIEIKLIDPYWIENEKELGFPTPAAMGPRLHYGDCKNILDHVTEEAKGISATDALDELIAYMYSSNRNYIVIDIESRNISYAPPKEMTVKEIEKALGYKVKIVGEK